MVNDVRPSISLAESEYLFRKISGESEGVSFELFIAWLNAYSEQTLKPLIVFKDDMMPEIADDVKRTEIPLSIQKLVNEMRDYGLRHIEDAFNQAIAETRRDFVGRKELEQIGKSISLTNFKKLLAVVSTGSSDDVGRLKTWLLENQLAQRYVRIHNSRLEIELAIDAGKVWEILMSRYRATSSFKMHLQGNTPSELASSIKQAILKRKINEMHKVIPSFTLDAECICK